VTRRRGKSKGKLGAFAVASVAALVAFPAAANAQVNSNVNGAGVLSVQSTAGDAITITNTGGNVKINGADPGSGVAAVTTITAIDVLGDDAPNNINLAGVDASFTQLTQVDVDGRGGNDLINGSQLADSLEGGNGNDRIIGDDNQPNTRDDMRGEAGDDTLVWNPGDDDDINEGGAGTDTAEVNGGGKEQFEVKPGAAPGRVAFDRVQPDPTFGAPFNVDISDDTEKLDLNAGGGDDIVNSAAGLDALAFALDIDGGDGNDTLDGGDGADTMNGAAGNDRVVGDDNPLNTRDLMLGGDGDDTLVWNPGDDDDINEGGAGTDTSEVNGGGKEQFEVKPSATPGRVSFDRVQPDPTFGAPFNVDISDDTEKLDLNAGADVDIVNAAEGLNALAFALNIDGGDGNDVIDGSDGADEISGGTGDDQIAADDNPQNTLDVVRGDAGNDTMTWNPGDDNDVNDGGDGNDTVVVNGATGDEDFRVKPSATAGRVQFDRVDPAPFSVDIGTSENLVVNGAGGNDEIKGSKGLAGLIASTFNGDDGKDDIKGTDGPDQLSGGKGGDLIRSIDRAADNIECGPGFDLALVDRRDTVRGCEIVLGGALKVKVTGKSANVSGGAAALTLRCVATQRCNGLVKLRVGGKTIASSKFAMGKKKTKRLQLKLNKRGLGLLAKASKKGLKVQLRVDAKDANGNGWRTDSALRLTR
jgi:Ca2+-binding RTX toxin-like protein